MVGSNPAVNVTNLSRSGERRHELVIDGALELGERVLAEIPVAFGNSGGRSRATHVTSAFSLDASADVVSPVSHVYRRRLSDMSRLSTANMHACT